MPPKWLPHGTDVTIRRLPTDGLGPGIPDGIAGRVRAYLDDGYMQIALLGEERLVRVSREQVVPTKAGQLRFAERREGDWNALHSTIVLETVVGSRAWGLANENSDTDLRGLFAAPFSLRLGLTSPPEDLVSANGSASYWGVEKGIRQALRCDPNTLEMLFLPTAKPKDEIGEWILAERDAFPSREILGSFGRYAISQLTKLAHSVRLFENREFLFDLARRDPFLTLDVAASKLAEVAKAPGGEQEAKERIKQLGKSLAERRVLPDASFASLVAFAKTLEGQRRDDLLDDLPSPIRPKNAYNLLRLMKTAEHWLRHGTPVFAFTGPFRDRLLAIKAGHVPLPEVAAEARALSVEVEAAHQVSKLPEKASAERADALLRRCNEALLRREFCKP